MHRDNEQAVRQFESQVSAFEERLETARTGSGLDRLTGLPSQRDIERHLEQMASCDQAMCAVLFDIEGFREINEKHGTLFGDQLLQALAHQLRTKFPEEGTLFDGRRMNSWRLPRACRQRSPVCAGTSSGRLHAASTLRSKTA